MHHGRDAVSHLAVLHHLSNLVSGSVDQDRRLAAVVPARSPNAAVYVPGRFAHTAAATQI